MMMAQDIRDKPTIRHDDVIGLNFISPSSPFFYRRHFRQGLRSHIMEILKRSDVEAENHGTTVDGTRWFPKARPTHMLRIFRARLKSLAGALAEIERVNVVARYLGPDYIAESSEFLVDYHGPEGRRIMLCGFQAYVEGEVLDPWNLLGAEDLLPAMFECLHGAAPRVGANKERWVAATKRKGIDFVNKIKQMIAEVRHIPDLAGAGNLILQKTGEIKLVDINNISPVEFAPEIMLDDKGYPVCDKSVEALALIERKVLGHSIDLQEPIYRFFLDPARNRQANRLEEQLYHRRAQSSFPS